MLASYLVRTCRIPPRRERMQQVGPKEGRAAKRSLLHVRLIPRNLLRLSLVAAMPLARFRLTGAMADLLTLPPHLLERIQVLLDGDIPLPDDLRERLGKAVDRSEAPQAIQVEDAYPAGAVDTQDNAEPSSIDVEDPPKGIKQGPRVDRPPVIDEETLESLARWASTPTGRRKLERKHLGMYLFLSR